jgi:flagellar biogenesis protein FliO
MKTEILRVSANAFRVRVIALWKRALRLGRRNPKRLRLCENLPLGERRFVAVVEFETERFLVGGTPSSLTLLSRLPDTRLSDVETQLEDEPEQTNWNAAAAAARKQRGEAC